ncbi:SAM-dependent methyltransferase [Marinomonas sp. 42_23_T18]|nr:SAM-dependent methyltransferase [Marinomonas sp. 42_23_T18]
MLPELPTALSDQEKARLIAEFEGAPVNRTVAVDEDVYRYLIDHSVRELEILREIRAETSIYHMSRMQISPETGQLLALLVKIHNPQRILEIGVFTGYSTLSIGLAMGENACMLALEKKAMWLDIANHYIEKAGLDDRLEARLGDALVSLAELKSEGRVFDFVFIDADKANQLAYYRQAKQMLSPGGCIAIDNTLWWGNVAKSDFNDKNTLQVRELNDFIMKDDEVDVSLIPIGDGLTLIRKKSI